MPVNFGGLLSIDGCLRVCNEDLIHYTCFPARNKKKLETEMDCLQKRKDSIERDLQAKEATGDVERSHEAIYWLERVESTKKKADTLVEKLSPRKRGLLSCFSLKSNYRSGKEVQLLLTKIEKLETQRGGMGELDKLTNNRKPSSTTHTQKHGRGEEQQRKEEDPWQLFCSSIRGGRADVNNPVIQEHAKDIVSKCGGLRLALAAVGRAVKNYQSCEEWESAIERLKNPPAPHVARPGKLSIELILRFCYDSLDSDLLRSCLLYCSLYQKNSIISEMQLILSWMGEGLLDSEDGSREFFSAYEKGLDIIRRLNDACFLEYHKQWCDFYLRLPKDVWDMAQKITDSHGNPYVVYCRTSGELSRRFWETAMRISITELDLTRGTDIIFNPLPSSDATSLPGNNVTLCLNLTTFWAAGNESLKGIHQDFCRFIPAVRVLDLSRTNIKEIPRTIKLLAQLEYLMLEKTNITTLPIELGDLKKLRMLDLSETKKLEIIPSVSISMLSALQSLRMDESAYSWDSSLSIQNEGPLIEDKSALLKLDDLENLGQMQTLWVEIRSIQTLEKLIKSFTSATTGLTVSGEHFDNQYVEKIIGRFSQLRWLQLYNCNKLEHLKIIRIELRFLQELKLKSLGNLYRISSKDGSPLFPYLRHLAIWNCRSLVDLRWAAHLPVLELLCLSCCKQLKQLIVRNEEESVGTIGEPFPKLQFLVLHELPELRCFSWGHPLCLPSLRSLRIIQCPKLKKLPLGRQSGKNITEIRGSQEWWDELQWDNDGIKSTFFPYFHPK